jgi:hypothetical protein
MFMQSIEVPRLSREEWSAVRVALLDAARGTSIMAPKIRVFAFVVRAYEAITGNRCSNRLADPKLETLRRYVGLCRRSRCVAESLVSCMLEHGFNRAQVEAIALLAA